MASSSPGDLHVAVHQLNAQRLGVRLDELARLVVQAGRDHFGAHFTHQARAAKGDAVVVGNTEDEAFFAGQAVQGGAHEKKRK